MENKLNICEEKIFSALGGLCGAVLKNGSSGVSADIDSVFIKSLAICKKSLFQELDDFIVQHMVDQIHLQKFLISPDCKICANPCGKTSDFNVYNFYNNSNESMINKKISIFRKCCDYGEKISACDVFEREKIDFLFKCISRITLELTENDYDVLLNELKSF